MDTYFCTCSHQWSVGYMGAIHWQLAVLVMLKRVIKNSTVGCLLLFSGLVFAEGIIDVNPYISPSLNYDDNVFRFSSPAQAQAAFATSATSDLIKRLDLGATINLRLSRQLVSLSASVSESRYGRFDILDNTAKSYGLGWNWRLGNDVYGVLSTNKREAIAGFNEIRNPVKNTRTTSSQLASIYWNYHPDWTVYASHEVADTENELINFSSLDRKDQVFETGLRFQNTLGTQVGLSYRVNESRYPNRAGLSQFFFGKQSEQESISVAAAWLPTPKTRISARFSQISIEYKDKPQRGYDGFGQRWDISHALTGKINLAASAYKEVAPIDDVESTYVQVTGVSFSPSWSLTSKISLRAGVGYEERDYLGSAADPIFNNNEDRNDISKTANLSLLYTPTDKTLVQLQYLGEKRTSSIDNQGYEFNNLNLSFRYDF
jgi:exopolysaccharide biosynthesis operon protein EpsL